MTLILSCRLMDLCGINMGLGACLQEDDGARLRRPKFDPTGLAQPRRTFERSVNSGVRPRDLSRFHGQTQLICPYKTLLLEH